MDCIIINQDMTHLPAGLGCIVQKQRLQKKARRHELSQDMLVSLSQSSLTSH
jgi:hypothetical protein